jgi:hypothetical protein
MADSKADSHADYKAILPVALASNGKGRSNAEESVINDDVLDAEALSNEPSFTSEDVYVVPPEEIEADEEDVADFPVVAKPGKQMFFRVHPRATWVVPLLKFDSTGDYFLCARGVDHPDVRDHRLYLARTHTGALLLWPVPLPRHGEDNVASRQQRAIAADATEMWTSMRWSGGKRGRYLSRKFPAYQQVVVWPEDLTFPRIVLRAFMDNRIDRTDDPRLATLPSGLE